ncbi:MULTISPECIES: radical SAM/SPASM domain-containing protein [unclassified Pseudomonas]|uniref:radical SAM/SPASM domain-containing protein n=1 Tax=unclassified Pseudomonas TaxID=196821 RepID=UPI001B3346D3|nr:MULTISPECIES: radical SAM/SPASM domain-containing protein [unclassified Pseudomonas]MBP5946705.1 radical SAM protein [Pseudomonas sp. P9(2020)]MBZ9564843.1 radical SAM protein [Pseudomonas sp. P116]
MNMYIDIVGACNLSCPSCPMGNSENLNFKKAMQLDMFRQIVEKAKREGVRAIFLYNWTEPLVHPKIGEFIEIINAAGMNSGVSTNLNLAKNMEKALLAEPGFFRISLSGFYQETYAKGHVGGDIEVVKQNMITLSELVQRHGLNTHVEVYYHRYLDNLAEEALMREFSERLGFTFSTGYSVMMPLEKALAIVERDPSVTDTDHETLKRLALPPYDDLVNVVQHFHKQACTLKDNWLVIDCNGNTVLCCTIFNQSEYQVGKYLDINVDELMKRKNTQKNCVDMCNRCVKKGMHIYAMYPGQGALESHAINRMIDFQQRTIAGLPIDSEQLGRAGEVSAQNFDEAQYLQLNDDVRQAVRTGAFTSGYQHYVLFGRLEGRVGAGLFSAV